MIVRPPRLRAGDRVAVVSTSWGGPEAFPRVFDAGMRAIEQLGLVATELPTTRWPADRLRADPRARAEDLNSAFADPSISAIFSSIGGDDSARILPYLDTETIIGNPKVLMGYSDTSTQLFFIHQLGLVTFNGPAVMAGFAQKAHFPGFDDQLRAILFEPTPTYEYRPFPHWIDTYEDWDHAINPSGIGALRAHDGWHWVHGTEPARGRLVGGCIDVLEMMKGSRFWPPVDWWQDRILFLETSEEVRTLDQVRAWVFNYGVQEILDRITGLIIGRAGDHSDERKRELDETIHAVVVEEFGASHVVIVTNMDFGHTDPQWILPLGVTAELDPSSGTFRLLEPAVE